MNDPDRGIRRLMWEATHQPVYHQGVSETALRKIASVVGELETVDPSTFTHPPSENPEVRQTIRFLSALVPPHIPDRYIPAYITSIIANPHLTSAMVEEIIAGGNAASEEYVYNGVQRRRYIDGATIRRVGLLLRSGATQRQVAEETGVARDLVSKLGAFLGVVDARDEMLRDLAADHLEEGTSDPDEFAAEYGLQPGAARVLLENEARGLGMEENEAQIA